MTDEFAGYIAATVNGDVWFGETAQDALDGLRENYPVGEDEVVALYEMKARFKRTTRWEESK